MNAKKLIEEIQVEKKIAISEGRLREEKALEPITDNDVPRKLPEGWEWCRLGDYAMKVTDYVASGSFASLKENVLITNDENYAVMVKTADFSNGFTKNLTYTDKQGYNFLENSNLFGGELILSNIGSIGKVFIVPDLKRPMTLASNTIMVRMTHNEYNKYMYYMFKSSFGQGLLMSISSGTSMLKFNKTQLKSTIIPIAPLEEQFRICDILDKVQGIIDKRKNQLQKLDNLIKARFVEMFGDPEMNPYGWQKINISNIVQGKVSNGYFAKRDEYVEDGNAAILGVAYIVNRMYSGIEGLPRTNVTLADIQKYKVRYGDMLFCRSSLVAEGIGKASIVPENVPDNTLFECHVIRLPLDMDKCVPEFMQVLSTTDYFRKQMIAQSKTATMTTIGQDGIKKANIILPPIEKQREFYSFVKQIDKSKFS